MESVELEINGRMITAHSGGSISWIHGKTGKLVNSFGTKDSNSYIRIGINGKMFLMHRIIAQAFLPDFFDYPQVDHVDGDRTNNDVSNLRMATSSSNQQAHQSKAKGFSSQYRGVYLRKDTSKWRAECKIDGKTKHIGYFTTEVDAALARDTYAASQGFPLEGLNFPECFTGS